jgi:hypothetical protein
MRTIQTALLLTMLSLSGCAPETDVSPKQAYACIAETSIPASVTGLHADGAIWQDYSIYARFTAPPEVIESILSLGYKPTTWDTIAEDMNHPSYTESFTPAWNPRAIVNKQCHVRKLEESDPGTHYLVIDSDSGTVYAVAKND